MRALAAFASSEEGRLYAVACERWSVDPGGILDDDVMAINLRVGLAKVLADALVQGEPAMDEPEPLKLATRG